MYGVKVGVMVGVKVGARVGVMVGSIVAVGPLLCDRRGAPAPEGQGLPASLRVGAAKGAHCHD
jgi:hypothetical protein